MRTTALHIAEETHHSIDDHDHSVLDLNLSYLIVETAVLGCELYERGISQLETKKSIF